jgi:hypothetical protein
MANDTLTLKRQPRRAQINGTRNKLNVKGKDPDYVYRIVNDIDDRISQMQEIGYELVTDSTVKVGDKRVAVPSAEGSPTKISVGGGTKAYVMRIKKEFYDEDQKAKQQLVDELEATTKREARDSSDYGKVSITRD